jgi:hypothetical protein
LFCISAKDGTLAWNAPFPGAGTPTTTPAPAGAGGPGGAAADRAEIRRNFQPTVFGQATPPEGERPRRPGGGPGGPGGGRRGGGGGGGGYGTIVDAGSVLLALTPAGQLVVFEPSAKELKVVATYKVGEGSTHAYPVVAGNRILTKDRDALTSWSAE